MSDVQLSVEVKSKMESLSAGLKRGKEDIRTFVETSIPALKELEKTLNSLGINTSSQGLKDIRKAVDAISGSTKAAFATKPLTEYQEKVIKLKQDTLDLAKSKLDQASADKSAIAASKASSDQIKSGIAAITAQILKNKLAQQEKNIADKEALDIQKKLNAEASKRNTTKISNSQSEVDNYNNVANGSRMVTSALSERDIAQARVTNGLIGVSAATRVDTEALQGNSAAQARNFVVKGKSALIIAEGIEKQRLSTAALKNWIRETSNEKGSIEQRRAALIRLNSAYDKLSVSERNSTYGSRMSGIIKGVTDQLKDLESATGRSQRNIGNYPNGFGKIGNDASVATGKIVELTNKLKFFQDALNRARAPQSFVNLNRKIEEINEALVRLSNAGKKGFDDLGNKTSSEALKAAIEQRKTALLSLVAAYNRMSSAEKQTAEGMKLGGIIKGITDQIKNLKSALDDSSSSLKNQGFTLNEFKSQLLSMAAGYVSFHALMSGLKSVVHTNAEISDSMADLERTAKLTVGQTDSLVKSLKGLDRRTNLEGLLDIGYIGGQLGVGKKDIQGYIEKIDELGVVLKKEFPGGAEAVATSLGKLISIYKITGQEGISLEQSLSKVGSALLGIAHDGPVSVQYLQDFALRTAGAAQVAKLSLPTMLAYGAVLSEAGVTAQVAASSVNRLISSLAGKREKYLAIAQLADSTLTIEEFTNLINTDTQKALDLFFRGLRAGNPTQTEFNDRMSTLNFKVGAATNSITALALGQDKLNRKINIGNEEYDSGTLSAENYAIKNDTLAASIDKVGNAFSNFTTNPNSGIGKALKNIIDTTTETIKALDSLSDKMVYLQELRDKSVVSIGGIDPGAFKRVEDRERESKASKYRSFIEANRDEVIAQGTIKAKDIINKNATESSLRSALKIEENLLKSYFEKRKAAIAFYTNPENTVPLQPLIGVPFTKDNPLAAAEKKAKDLQAVLLRQKTKVDVIKNALIGKYGAVQSINEQDDTGQGGERTIPVIEKEIQSLVSANKKLGTASVEFKKNLDKLKVLKEELRVANGGSIKTVKNPFDGIGAQLQEFHNKSNIITKDGLEKDLQEWDDKYRKIKAVIAKLPAGAEKQKASQTLEANYTNGRANYIVDNSKKVQEAIKKNQDAIELAELGGDAKELANLRAKYTEMYKLAQGNASAIAAIKKAEGEEISTFTKENAARDLNIVSKQIADVAKEYRDHQAEMFVLSKTNGPLAVEVAENDKAKQELKQQYSDRLVTFEEYQERMSNLIKKGNELEIKPPKFDFKRFSETIREASRQMNDLISTFVDSGISGGIANAFASIGESLVNGGNIFAAAGKAVLNTIAGFLGEMGTMLIKKGVATVAAGIALNMIIPGSGAKEVAGGLALIAAGGALAVSGGIGSALVSGSGGSSKKDKGLPQFAMGVQNFGGGLAIVGERGPEVVNLPTGADVIPNHKVMQSITGGGNTQIMIPEVRLSGQDIFIAFKRTERNNKRG